MIGSGYYKPDQKIPGTHYICVRVLGEGGFGVVYVVQHDWTGQRYALKTLHAFLADRADLAIRMRNEAMFLAKIRHPNVVSVTDGGVTDDGRPYLVMEFLNGEPLSQTLAEMPHGLGPKWTLGLLELLDGLEVVHKKGAIHRDIKPGNVFLQAVADEITGSVQSRPILLDFGISHFMRNQKPITGQMFMGTQKYAAPEQIRGETPTPKTDIYSMGLVFYECLCGRGPFDHLREPTAIAHAHLTAEPKHLSSLVRGIDDVADLVMRMLAKDPAQRPPSAGWLAVAFRERRIQLEAENDLASAANENQTDPTPLDNRFITLSVPLSDRRSDIPAKGPITAAAVPDALRFRRASDTIPDPLPSFIVDAIRERAEREANGEISSDTRHRRVTIEVNPINRLATTPTMPPLLAREPTHGTDPIVKPGTIVLFDSEDDVYMPPPSEAVESALQGPDGRLAGDMIGGGSEPREAIPAPRQMPGSDSPSSSAAAAMTVGTVCHRRPAKAWQDWAIGFCAAVVAGVVFGSAGIVVLGGASPTRRASAAPASDTLDAAPEPSGSAPSAEPATAQVGDGPPAYPSAE